MTKIYVLKWSEIFDEFSKRHEYLLDKLKLEEELFCASATTSSALLCLRSHNSSSSFIFTYKRIEYIVLVKRFVGTEKRVNKYALVKLHFIKSKNLDDDYKLKPIVLVY